MSNRWGLRCFSLFISSFSFQMQASGVTWIGYNAISIKWNVMLRSVIEPDVLPCVHRTCTNDAVNWFVKCLHLIRNVFFFFIFVFFFSIKFCFHFSIIVTCAVWGRAHEIVPQSKQQWLTCLLLFIHWLRIIFFLENHLKIRTGKPITLITHQTLHCTIKMMFWITNPFD